MFERKTNEEIGSYLKGLILSKYPSCRKFCIDYIKNVPNLNESNASDDDEIRKLTNRLSQILNGKKGIQTYDLPIFSELLDVSCEEMLSAGATRKPITNRITNYSIAFSNNERDWIDYLNRNDCIACYADEFGKTVVDYAIEFRNYKFLKFLIKDKYIVLKSDDNNFNGFGAYTKLKPRPYESNTLERELNNNKVLRTQIISLALINNDYSILDEMRARVFPPQLEIDYLLRLDINFSEYYNEDYINTIIKSKKEIIEYFCEEYEVTSKWQNVKFKWIFPYIDKLIIKSINNNEYCNILLDAAIKHNENTFNELKKEVLKATKNMYDSFLNLSFQDTLNKVLREFFIFNKKDVISFWGYFIKDSKKVLTNIVYVDEKSKNKDIQSKIDKLNNYYSRIINIKDYIIK